MALTSFQRAVCKLLAQDRIASGESYVAGAAALNELLNAPRVSRDVDVFHDTERAVDASWSADRKLLEGSGLRATWDDASTRPWAMPRRRSVSCRPSSSANAFSTSVGSFSVQDLIGLQAPLPMGRLPFT